MMPPTKKKKEKKKVDVFVLADTTFGSCCVDEVAALHHNADCIVHVGFSCCSKTSRLNARMVYQKKSLEVNACAEKIREHTKTTLGDSVRVVVVLMEQKKPKLVFQRMENAVDGNGKRRCRERWSTWCHQCRQT